MSTTLSVPRPVLSNTRSRSIPKPKVTIELPATGMNDREIEQLLEKVDLVSGIFVVGVGLIVDSTVIIDGESYEKKSLELGDVISCYRLRGDRDSIFQQLKEVLSSPTYKNRQLVVSRFAFTKGDSVNSSSFVVYRKGGLVEGCLSTVEEAVAFCHQIVELSNNKYLRVTDLVIEEWLNQKLLCQIGFFNPIVINNIVDKEERKWLILRDQKENQPPITIQEGLKNYLCNNEDIDSLDSFYWPFYQLDC